MGDERFQSRFCKKGVYQKLVATHGTQRNSSRFLEAEVVRALKDVRDIIELAFVLNRVVRTTVNLGLGRASRGACGCLSLICGALSFRLLTIV